MRFTLFQRRDPAATVSQGQRVALAFLHDTAHCADASEASVSRETAAPTKTAAPLKLETHSCVPFGTLGQGLAWLSTATCTA